MKLVIEQYDLPGQPRADNILRAAPSVRVSGVDEVPSPFHKSVNHFVRVGFTELACHLELETTVLMKMMILTIMMVMMTIKLGAAGTQF